jgi:hypothetical protein
VFVAREAFDALPFAAEPTVAALDLVLDAVTANFTRATLVALLRSPHFIFSPDGVPITREATSALDRALSGARYLGDPERLDGLTASPDGRFEARSGRLVVSAPVGFGRLHVRSLSSVAMVRCPRNGSKEDREKAT